jgi:D-alanyl-D-alanine carboxypeptidase
MKKQISSLMFLIYIQMLMIAPILANGSELPVPEIESGAAILMDSETGTVLYERVSQERMYPASITKIVTGIVAIESGLSDETVTVSEAARYEDGTRVFLAPGERKPMELLLYGLLLNSGNDAATAIAEHIAGSKESFADRMNEFVKQLDLHGTHFTNPHGLFDEQQYTTALDMAIITQHAMKNELFRQIVATKTLPWDGEEWDSELVNHNKLLWRYEGATGVKNGYTVKSGNTLVAAAERDGSELIVVLLKGNGSESIYEDAVHLFDYGFESIRLNPLEPVPNSDPGGIEEDSEVVSAQAALDNQAMEEKPAALEPAVAPAKQESQVSIWLVRAAWLSLNLFLGLAGYLLIKKRRSRSKNRFQKK